MTTCSTDPSEKISRLIGHKYLYTTGELTLDPINC